MTTMFEEHALKTAQALKNYTFKRVPANPLRGINLKVEQVDISPASHHKKLILRAFTI